MQLIFGSPARKFFSFAFVLAIVYWFIFVLVSGFKQHPLGLYTQFPLIVIPIFGGFLGLKRFFEWGGLKSVMGRVLLGLSVGMILWGIALGMWTYYIIAGTAVPYPSYADYVFIWSPILWIYSVVQLSKVVGAPFGMRNSGERIIGVLATIIIGAVSYYILVIIAHGNILSAPGETFTQVFFDYAYTVGALALVVIVGAAYVFSRKYLGGRYKLPVLFLFFGFIAHFFAIFFLVYTITKGTYFNGNVADVFFTVAIYLENLGIINLDTRLTTNGQRKK